MDYSPVINGVTKVGLAALSGHKEEFAKAQLQAQQSKLAEQQMGLVEQQAGSALTKNQAIKRLQGIIDSGGLSYNDDGTMKITPGRGGDVANFIASAQLNGIDVSNLQKAIEASGIADRDYNMSIGKIREENRAKSLSVPQGTDVYLPEDSIYNPAKTQPGMSSMIADSEPALPINDDIPQNSPLVAAATAGNRPGPSIGAVSPNGGRHGNVISNPAPVKDSATTQKFAREDQVATDAIDTQISNLEKAKTITGKAANPALGVPVIGGLVDKATQAYGSEGALARVDRNKLAVESWLALSAGLKGSLTEQEGARLDRAIPDAGASQVVWDRWIDNAIQAANEARAIIQARQGKPSSLSGAASAGMRGKPQVSSGPAVGTVQDGYEFIGGDPANPQSWRQVQ